MRRERDVEKFDRPAKIDLPLGVSAQESSGAGEGTGETQTGEAEGTEAPTLEQAWKEGIARLQDPNTPLTEVMAAARQAALLGGADAGLPPELDAVVTARLEQAWKEGIARLQDPNTPLTEVMAAARQAEPSWAGPTPGSPRSSTPSSPPGSSRPGRRGSLGSRIRTRR
ncbi:MAG: hypothetical protein KatS3mg065_0300 [Chloroflexota bacterium]|nr:MAG: hypothetical protein KatS3mg065_0300 [Chloroflexota bacterium]